MADGSAARLALLSLMLVAAWFDLRTRRIPNWLSLGGAGAGLLLAAAMGGWGGLGGALLGWTMAFVTFFAFYLLGAMGAGDVKLMAAGGTFLGFPVVFTGMFWTAVAGGVMAFALMMISRGLATRAMENLGRLLAFWWTSRRIRKAEWLTFRSPGAVNVPYGLAIALGCAVAAWLPQLPGR